MCAAPVRGVEAVSAPVEGGKSAGRFIPSRTVAIAVGSLLYALYAVVLGFQLLPKNAGSTLSTVVHTVTVIVASILLTRRGMRMRGRVSWSMFLIAAGLLVGVAVGVLTVISYYVPALDATPRTWSLVDTVYLFVLPFIVAGLLMFPTNRNIPGSFLSTLLDGMLAGSGLWLCMYLIWMEPHMSSPPVLDATFAKTVIYPAMDLFIVGMSMSVYSRASVEYKNILRWVTGGLILWSISDVVYTVGAYYTPASWVAVIGETGLIMLCVGAVLLPKPAKIATNAELDDQTFFNIITDTHPDYDAFTPKNEQYYTYVLMSVFPFVFVLFAWVLSFIMIVDGDKLSPFGEAGAAALTGLVLARIAIGWWDRTQLAQKLDYANKLYRALIVDSADAVGVVSEQGTLTYASPVLVESLKSRYKYFTSRNLLGWVHPEEKEQVLAAFTRTVEKGPGAEEETVARLISVDGTWRWVNVGFHNRITDKAVCGIVVNGHDIHQHMVMQNNLEYAAFHDPLTKLGNLEMVRKLLASRTSGHLMLMDLDGFKTVNDTHGHHMGDVLLQEVAERLERLAGEYESDVCRLGGDEFVILTPPHIQMGEAAEAFLKRVKEPYYVEGHRLGISASIGVATVTEDKLDGNVLRDADLAMYAAKKAGKNRWLSYEDFMHSIAAENLNIVNTLHEVLHPAVPRTAAPILHAPSPAASRAEDASGEARVAELTVAYQPIVSLDGKHTVGMEALARLRDKRGATLRTDRFVEIAEQTGLIEELGENIITQVCTHIAAWQEQEVPLVRVSVNVSRSQLNTAFADFVEKTCAEKNIPPSLLCVEITESAPLTDTQQAVETLEKLRTIGVTVALDDFGTGESSLTQLGTLPIDVVKLDREFALHSSTQQGWGLLEGVIGLCHTLGFTIVAEGIETAQLADRLSTQGVQWGQGYFFAKPMPCDDMTEYLTTHTVLGNLPAVQGRRRDENHR